MQIALTVCSSTVSCLVQVKVLSLLPDDEFLKLYELYKSLLASDDEDTKKLVVFYPELFIEMAKEIVKLRNENRQLKVSVGQGLMQREYANRLYEQLQCIKRDLDEMGVRLPYKFR